MKMVILAALLVLLSAIALSSFFSTRVRPFARLMDALPADRDLCAADQCIKECGHIWFFYGLARRDGQMRLTVSLNIPCPESPEDLAALDAEVRTMTGQLGRTLPLLRCEWREMEGPLAMRLYLELDWKEVRPAPLKEFQERSLEIIRDRHAEAVRRQFRGSGDYDIYYSEQVGNIIERSLDMVNAFDIRKYSFKSEGLLGYNEKNEIPATEEEFEELYAAAKPDIEVTGLTLRDLKAHFADLFADGTVPEKPLLVRRGRKNYLEAWYKDAANQPQFWAVECSGSSWWVYNFDGDELGDVYEMDTEEEACDLFVRYVAEAIQDACSHEG